MKQTFVSHPFFHADDKPAVFFPFSENMKECGDRIFVRQYPNRSFAFYTNTDFLNPLREGRLQAAPADISARALSYLRRTCCHRRLAPKRNPAWKRAALKKNRIVRYSIFSESHHPKRGLCFPLGRIISSFFGFVCYLGNILKIFFAANPNRLKFNENRVIFIRRSCLALRLKPRKTKLPHSFYPFFGDRKRARQPDAYDNNPTCHPLFRCNLG
jgi:hypothetical protein